MSRQSEHIINRKITHSFKSSGQAYTARSAIAIKEICYLRNDIILSSFEYATYQKIVNDIEKQLLIYDKNRPPHFVPKDLPEVNLIMKLLLPYFLAFRVTSEKNFIKFFGDNSIAQIYSNAHISTYKDLLNPTRSDNVIIFCASTFYCVNRFNTISNKPERIPFSILNSRYDFLDKILFKGDKLSFLFEVYYALKDNYCNDDFLFSPETVMLYRAYEKIYPYSNALVSSLQNSDKNKMQNKNRVSTLKEATYNLLVYIKDNISFLLDNETLLLDDMDIAQYRLDTTDLLQEIENLFISHLSESILSINDLFSIIMDINDTSALKRYANLLLSLYSISDNFMTCSLRSITFHIIEEKCCPKSSISKSQVIEHIVAFNLDLDSIWYLANLFYNASGVSEIDLDLMHSLAHSINNCPEVFDKIYNIVLAYNPI